MHIVQIASELAPIAKVGGLADVVYGLSKALKAQGHLVEIVLPKYDIIDETLLKKLKIVQDDLFCKEGENSYKNTIWSASFNGLKILLVETHHPRYYFERGQIYGCPDDTERFLYFCRVCTDFLSQRKRKPSVIHLHDWPSAIIPALLIQNLTSIPTVLTLHNLEHQGLCSLPHIEQIMPPPLNPVLLDMKNPKVGNLLKAGIELSNAITTVSSSYEQEIQTPEGGFGLQSILTQHQSKLFGILNGIDIDYYNPVSDPAVLIRYKASSFYNPSKVQAIKEKNKKALFAELNIPYSPKWLLCAITRLAHQKSPELIAYAMEKTLELGGQFILLGSLHGDDYTHLFEDLQKKYQGNPHALIFLQKDDQLAHKLYAASDALIIPSLFEPCGLTQMIAMRYGTLPLVRRTGGLADTVFDVETSDKPEKERTGFTFDYPDKGGVDWVLTRAFTMYTQHREKWLALMENGMQKDFSWDKPAESYSEIYVKLKARLM